MKFAYANQTTYIGTGREPMYVFCLEIRARRSQRSLLDERFILRTEFFRVFEEMACRMRLSGFLQKKLNKED
jgi:hypothetical protein